MKIDYSQCHQLVFAATSVLPYVTQMNIFFLSRITNKKFLLCQLMNYKLFWPLHGGFFSQYFSLPGLFLETSQSPLGQDNKASIIFITRFYWRLWAGGNLLNVWAAFNIWQSRCWGQTKSIAWERICSIAFCDKVKKSIFFIQQI